jgi:phospholipase/lecithinase/hemolysin
MTNSKHFFLPLALFILFLCISPSSAHNKSHNSSHSQKSYEGCFSKVYAFGDSYTDTGNCVLLGGLKSFVTSIFSHSTFGSVTNFQKSTNRQCDGRLVIDFLCETLSLPNLPPYKDTSSDFSHGANFAISGSTSLSMDFFIGNKVGHNLMWKGMPQSLLTQIDWFTKFRQESSYKIEMEKALFWIGEMGLNDYARIDGSSISTQWLTQLTVAHVCKLMKTLLDSGAKYIVVQGLPPVGCLPLALSSTPSYDRDQMGCSASANLVTKIHNELLQAKLAEFRMQYSHCTIIYADYWNAYKTILMNPKKYQIEEPFKACCGCGCGEHNFNVHSLCGSPGTSACKDPSKYISWDGVHLTEAMHRHLANLFFHQESCQPSFDRLIRSKKGDQSAD